MSKSYDRNIERLKANMAQTASRDRELATWEGNIRGQERIKHVRETRERLSPFSKALQEWKTKDIEKKKQEGIEEARKARLEQAKLLPEAAKKIQAIEEAKAAGELLDTFEDAKAMDLEHQKLKKQMLDAAGPNSYPEADRLARLSPWQQVGYAQEKLRVFNESFDAKLAHEMQNSTKQIELSGIKFTPSEIKDNNLAFPMKQAAIEILSDDIRKAHGIDRWSPEMLRLSKTEDAIQKAKDNQRAKYRKRYGIESSMGTRQKAQLEWKRSEKTGKDLEKLILVNSATIDTKGNILGNAGAWKEVESILVKEGVTRHNPEYAARVLDQPIPASMARELGVKPGTTFSEHWPARAAALRLKIKDGIKKGIDAESDWLKSAGTQKTNEFIEEARKGDLSTERVNENKREYAELGLPIPSAVTNYETATMRDEREDKQAIEYLMASNNGYISHEQLDQYHPKAALEFREKATKFEKAALKDHDAEKKIKAHLDTTFVGMGIKDREKSPAYVEAMANAKADYAVQYHRYVAMGYSSAVASHLALRGKPGEIKDLETGEPIPGAMGVLTEIEANGSNSKYVIAGQSVEKTLEAGHIRVARIASGKEEMRNDSSIIHKGTIGGDYGKKQLDSIIANIDKYGWERGIHMDKGAKQYYQGLTRGRTGNWMGLVDAQLKATGHPGLWKSGRPPVQTLLEGTDEEGNQVFNPETRDVAREVARTSCYPSKSTYIYNGGLMKDGSGYTKGNPFSVFDTPEFLIIPEVA